MRKLGNSNKFNEMFNSANRFAPRSAENPFVERDHLYYDGRQISIAEPDTSVNVAPPSPPPPPEPAPVRSRPRSAATTAAANGKDALQPASSITVRSNGRLAAKTVAASSSNSSRSTRK